jgi:hypothetical protein
MQIRRTSGTSRCGICPQPCAGGQKDRAKYLAIGESDGMTLKSTKPKIETQAH